MEFLPALRTLVAQFQVHLGVQLFLLSQVMRCFSGKSCVRGEKRGMVGVDEQLLRCACPSEFGLYHLVCKPCQMQQFRPDGHERSHGTNPVSNSSQPRYIQLHLCLHVGIVDELISSFDKLGKLAMVFGFSDGSGLRHLHSCIKYRNGIKSLWIHLIRQYKVFH